MSTRRFPPPKETQTPPSLSLVGKYSLLRERESEILPRARVPAVQKELSPAALMFRLALCPRCNGQNWLALKVGKIMPMSKCLVCGELVPTELFLPVRDIYGNNPRELWMKRRELERAMAQRESDSARVERERMEIAPPYVECFPQK